jgi:hypothetical protein
MFENILSLPTYCERLTSGFLGEPINLLSSFLYIVAALTAWRNLTNSNNIKHKNFLQLMCLLVALIGIGSALYHSYPNRTTLLLDALPIYVLLVSLLAFLVNKIVDSPIFTVCIIFVYISTLLLGSLVWPELANGSVRHIITITFLSVVLSLLYKKFPVLIKKLFLILVLFIVSLIARSLDVMLCSSLTIGTHFIWHIINAFAVYLLLTTIKERV